MGLFSTVLHIYKSKQAEIVRGLQNELKQTHRLSNFKRLDINNTNFEKVFSESIYSESGVFYLITGQHGLWTSIIELNVNIANPFYLYEMTNSLSRRLNTYALSFHLHDDDVLLYNLDKKGQSLDGYNSNYQYFLIEAAHKDEIISQRHTPQMFSEILPATKDISTLNAILNEGYWNAFDNSGLDEDGIPNGDKYDTDEEERFVRIGKYLEIFAKENYPFANWRENLSNLNLSDSYLLKASALK